MIRHMFGRLAPLAAVAVFGSAGSAAAQNGHLVNLPGAGGGATPVQLVPATAFPGAAGGAVVIIIVPSQPQLPQAVTVPTIVQTLSTLAQARQQAATGVAAQPAAAATRPAVTRTPDDIVQRLDALTAMVKDLSDRQRRLEEAPLPKK